MTTTGASRSAPPSATEPAVARAATLNLVLATAGFMVNFWAWALLGPLGPGIKERLGLSFAAQSLLVAVPVVVGSLGRIPIGVLTDRFGARIMFPAVSLATVVPVLTLPFVSRASSMMLATSRYRLFRVHSCLISSAASFWGVISLTMTVTSSPPGPGTLLPYKTTQAGLPSLRATSMVSGPMDSPPRQRAKSSPAWSRLCGVKSGRAVRFLPMTSRLS